MTRRLPALLTIAVLAAILALAAGLRLENLVPPELGVLYTADADEGIYAASAKLGLDGFLPYRNYLCSAPPVALYLFSAVLARSAAPWGSVEGFMALRYASVVSGLLTILVLYGIGALAGGRWAGWLAALLLAIDGWAVAQDRRAMLEAPMNLFSALAVLAFVLAARQRNDRRWYLLAGALGAAAMLSKTQGMVVLAALVLAALVQRQWRPALAVALGAVGAWFVLGLPYLVSAGDDMLRQLYLFQFLRPANGDPALMLRINAIRNFPQAWLTVRLGLLGAALLLLRLLWQRRRPAAPQDDLSPWLAPFFWAVLVALSFMASKTFYLYYYAQLAPPLALLAGSLLHMGEAPPPSRQAQRLLRAVPALLAMLVLVAGMTRVSGQMAADRQIAEATKPAHVQVAQYLRDNTPAESRILVFEPNYTFLAGREPARLRSGKMFLDSHAQMLYSNLHIKERAWGDLLAAIFRRGPQDEQALLWQEPAQQEVLDAFAMADYVIIDRRARYVLSPASLDAIEQASGELQTFDDVTVRMRIPQP